MRDCIKETAAKMVDGAKPQCFVLFVLSHGDILVNGTEVVFGTDGETVSKMEIKDALSDTACPVLREVPRILFYQCCRGGVVAVLLFCVVHVPGFVFICPKLMAHETN